MREVIEKNYIGIERYSVLDKSQPEIAKILTDLVHKHNAIPVSGYNKLGHVADILFRAKYYIDEDNDEMCYSRGEDLYIVIIEEKTPHE